MATRTRRSSFASFTVTTASGTQRRPQPRLRHRRCHHLCRHRHHPYPPHWRRTGAKTTRPTARIPRSSRRSAIIWPHCRSTYASGSSSFLARCCSARIRPSRSPQRSQCGPPLWRHTGCAPRQTRARPTGVWAALTTLQCCRRIRLGMHYRVSAGGSPSAKRTFCRTGRCRRSRRRSASFSSTCGSSTF